MCGACVWLLCYACLLHAHKTHEMRSLHHKGNAVRRRRQRRAKCTHRDLAGINEKKKQKIAHLGRSNDRIYLIWACMHHKESGIRSTYQTAAERDPDGQCQGIKYSINVMCKLFAHVSKLILLPNIYSHSCVNCLSLSRVKEYRYGFYKCSLTFR